MNVIAVLPYLVEHFEEPTKVCTEVAEYIAQVQRFILYERLEVYFHVIHCVIYHPKQIKLCGAIVIWVRELKVHPPDSLTYLYEGEGVSINSNQKATIVHLQ